MLVSFKEGHSIAETVARKFQRYCSWVPFDDLYQEAWIGILTAKKYDETISKNKKGYLYGAAFNKVSVHVCSFRLVLSGGHFRVKDKLAMMRPEKPEKIYEILDQNTPEEILIKKEESERVQKEIAKDCGINAVKAKLVTLLISGEFRAREIAELLGIEVNKVYRLTKEAKENIKNSEPLRKMCEE
jgi:RNA polymerase sigma factor (sigma-70 family)